MRHVFRSWSRTYRAIRHEPQAHWPCWLASPCSPLDYGPFCSPSKHMHWNRHMLCASSVKCVICPSAKWLAEHAIFTGQLRMALFAEVG